MDDIRVDDRHLSREWKAPGTETEILDGFPFPVFQRSNGALPTDRQCLIATVSDGHRVRHWNPDDENEVADMRLVFENLQKTGRQAYYANEKEGVLETMDEFDPAARAFLILPRAGGG